MKKISPLLQEGGIRSIIRASGIPKALLAIVPEPYYFIAPPVVTGGVCADRSVGRHAKYLGFKTVFEPYVRDQASRCASLKSDDKMEIPPDSFMRKVTHVGTYRREMPVSLERLYE